MTAFANIVLPDGLGVPVNHTFSKVKLGDGPSADIQIASWEDRVSGFSVGFNKITQSQRFPGKNVKSTKISVKITAPVMEVVSNSTVSGIPPAPTVSYTPLCTIDVVLPERSSLASRADLYAFIAAYVATNEFKNAVKLLEPVN